MSWNIVAWQQTANFQLSLLHGFSKLCLRWYKKSLRECRVLLHHTFVIQLKVHLLVASIVISCCCCREHLAGLVFFFVDWNILWGNGKVDSRNRYSRKLFDLKIFVRFFLEHETNNLELCENCSDNVMMVISDTLKTVVRTLSQTNRPWEGCAKTDLPTTRWFALGF